MVLSGNKVRAVSSFYLISMSTSECPPSAVELLPSDTAEVVALLTASDDAYGGVIVDMKTHMDSRAFVSSLRASISHWRQQVVSLILCSSILLI